MSKKTGKMPREPLFKVRDDRDTSRKCWVVVSKVDGRVVSKHSTRAAARRGITDASFRTLKEETRF